MKEPSEILKEIAKENSYEGWYSLIYDSPGYTVHEFTELAMTRYAEQFTKWIDVNDRLPETEGYYLVVIDQLVANKKRGQVHVSDLFSAVDMKTMQPTLRFQDYITHWMPLPSPPPVNKKD